MVQVTITGRFTGPDLSPAAGYITFTPRPGYVVVAGVRIELGEVTAALDNTGSFTVSLQATDDPAANPTGWTYLVREVIDGTTRTYDINVPAATVGTLDLSTIAPIPSASGSVQLTPGPTGPAGPHDGTQNEYGYNLNAGFGMTPWRSGMAASLVTSGAVNLAYARAPKTTTVGNIKFGLNVIASGGTITNSRLGVWSVDPTTGALLALLASTANDITLFTSGASVTVPKIKALQSTLAVTADTWYAAGLLFVGTGTAPQIQFMLGGGGGGNNMPMSSLPRLNGSVAGQSDLPASVAAGAVGAANVALWAELIP